MDAGATTQAPSSLFQPHPAKFAIARISVHDASSSSSPVLSLIVDPLSSGFSIHHPTPDTVEYTQDPENIRPQHTTSSDTSDQLNTSSTALRDFPPLLLKIHAREGLRLSFELKGDVMDSVQPRLILKTEPGTRTGILSREALEQDQLQIDQATERTRGDVAHTSSTPRRNSNPGVFLTDTTITGSEDESFMTALAGITSLSGDACATTPEQVSTTSTSTLHAPTIYFVETQTEQAMHALCSETAFQQQLADRPGSVSVVQATKSSDDNRTFNWDWMYHNEERSEQRLQSHKAVFAFLNRSRSTGALEILTMFSLLIQHSAPPPTTPLTTNAGVRLPPAVQNTAWKARHWRRSSTPEKSFTTGRLPAFWNKLQAFPPNQTSPSYLQETLGPMDVDRLLQDLQSQQTSGSNTPSTVPLAMNTEDGPLFRATVAESEQYIRTMKQVSKRVVKAAQHVLDTRRAWVTAEELFVKELENVRFAESLVEQYLRPLTENLAEQSEMMSQHMRNLVVEPFSQFFGIDIKAAELQRKSFEDESKDYYNFLSRYMGMKQDNMQKKQEADTKHDKRRRHFEAKRLEYWRFLTSMKESGNKGEELCSCLSEFTEKHCQHVVSMGAIAEELQPDLTAIATDNRQRYERNRVRPAVRPGMTIRRTPSRQYIKNGAGVVLTQSMIRSSASDASLDSPRTPHSQRNSIDFSTQDQDIPVPVPALNASQLSNTNSTTVSGIRDLEHQDIDAGLALGRRKEGFLFATSRPSTHNVAVLEKPSINWHKYWCVLSEGQLHEYSNWKKGVTLPHNDPINLRIATVRSCRDQDRRFCFEIITPKYRRVYQATSMEDMNSWISVISNAIQGLLNGTSSCRNLNVEYTTNKGNKSLASPDGKGLMAGLGGMNRASMEQVLNATSLPTSLQDRVQHGQAVGRKRGGSAMDGLNELGQIITPLTAQSRFSEDLAGMTDQLGAQLLKVMRESHPRNMVCADCGAKNPDWCVINLGILVCIECSGIHRSLGTHISKVRSMTLDTTSYTKDLSEFIRSVGNDVSNQIWEADLVQSTEQLQALGNQSQTSKTVFRKPIVNDSREYKISFIRKKYVDKAFVDQSLRQGDAAKNSSLANDALFRAVSANDIPAALAAFAQGADINLIQKANHESDQGPFFEPQASSSPHPLSPIKNTESTFDLSALPTLSISPTLDDDVLQSSSLDDSTNSEASSQLSGVTTASQPSSTTERNEDSYLSPLEQKQTAMVEIRPRPSGGRPISSVMVLQTSPLLIALRHGVPFSFNEQFVVYPLAEFLMQNGAASNMSMEVKLLTSNPTTLPTRPLKGGKTPPEDVSEGMIERDIPQLTSGSIGSRLASATESSSVNADDMSRTESKSLDAEDADDSKAIDKRSLGQIVELRGEDSAAAVEYLRAKRLARGEGPSMLSTSPPSIPAASTVTTGTRSWQGGSRPRTNSLKDVSAASTSTPSMSNTLIDNLTLSPRLKPSGSVTSGSLPISSATLPSTGFRDRESRLLPANRQYPPPSNPEISVLFQLRRDSDGGIGSNLFSTIKGASTKDKERVVIAKAQARRSGDFSFFRPLSVETTTGQLSDASSFHSNYTYSPTTSEHGPTSFSEGLQSNISATISTSARNSLTHGNNNNNNNDDNSNGNSNSNSSSNTSSNTNSNTNKRKSIRMSAAYFRSSIIKDTTKDGKKSSRAGLRTTTLVEDSARENDYDDDDDEEELTMAELLARQNEHFPRLQLSWSDLNLEEPSPPLAPVSPSSDLPTSEQTEKTTNLKPSEPKAQARRSSLSFFTGLSFASTPNLLSSLQQESRQGPGELQ
ncbi:hypothetical protein BGZ99_008233 [Dissophora globulifera]|uniref:ArfGap-domain-containing protein n=1 Tax=Dissophora globulifera TaxID=979702 RepID=A0A9P6R8N9_9FUNG|nr:hypothetical protein BGZ99_008233 [Dissophora globulifera]